MKKILVRADDLGYCEAVNYGIARAVKSGIIRCVGVMANMEWAEHGVRLLDGEPVIFTLHSNISQGRPITDPKLIPSMVEESGEFRDNQFYRTATADPVVLEEAVLELEAQFQRLVELTGRKPYCVERHAVPSENYIKAMQIVAERNGVPFMYADPKNPVQLGNYKLKSILDGEYFRQTPFEAFKRGALMEMAEDECCLMVTHPGYVDTFVYETSFINRRRAEEVAFAINPEVPKWCEENGVQLLTYADL